jgi:hypothetical protein
MSHWDNQDPPDSNGVEQGQVRKPLCNAQVSQVQPWPKVGIQLLALAKWIEEEGKVSNIPPDHEWKLFNVRMALLFFQVLFKY